MPLYVTTFCNFAHCTKTGKPINHECYVIPPRLLRAEMELNDWEEIRSIWESWHKYKTRKLHKGIKT